MGHSFSLGVISKLCTIDPRDWEREMDLLREIGVGHAEVLLDYPLGNEKIPFGLVDSLASWSRDAGIEIIVHGPFAGKSLTDPHPGIRSIVVREHLHTLDIAARLGARVYTIHSGIYRESDEKVREYDPERVMRESIEHIIEKAGKLGITIAIENPKPFGPPLRRYPANATQVLEFIKSDDRLRATLDTGHAILASEDPIEIVRLFASRIVDIHLHDCDSERDHIQLGEGCLDIPGFLRVLIEKGYSGYLTIEIHNTPEGDGRREAVERVRSVLKGMGYL